MPARASLDDHLLVPDKIYDELFKLYGGDANVILKSQKIALKTPTLTEIGYEVPMTISGEKGLVESPAYAECMPVGFHRAHSSPCPTTTGKFNAIPRCVCAEQSASCTRDPGRVGQGKPI
jgi:hypothetical protein